LEHGIAGDNCLLAPVQVLPAEDLIVGRQIQECDSWAENKAALSKTPPDCPGQNAVGGCSLGSRGKNHSVGPSGRKYTGWRSGEGPGLRVAAGP